jgi:hypothetical protein
MDLMLPAMRAELLQLQPFGSGFLVLHVGIVLPLALGALESDDFSWH